ncbi:hypothetical protein [Moraxella catarrhalis]|uniref:hypothetical protein n=2 Tax=Moraxella catarrhalis TaxID=480 RepID=UPI000202A874|nr:hypothetical protein [Moraxella catarrhalis]AIK00916.1 hypothetical protein DR90_1085 [Moraxella catarrhalis]ARB67615.1 hypothetical protein A6J52_06615 [Moraxella catarrhalis]AVL51082.1 hypothetical protein CEP83_08900 [Moraxella catarrhalis]EGE17609.1 hypothetical protein E9Q_06303 [Moraxella catarrhalis BC1]KZR94204.1 hypothetical protein A4U55_08160 [Moraxella catarrhalis]
MDKKPEKITIKIKKEDLGDLDEITIEVQQKESAVDKVLNQSIEGAQSLHHKAKINGWYRKIKILVITVLVIYLSIFAIIFIEPLLWRLGY